MASTPKTATKTPSERVRGLTGPSSFVTYSVVVCEVIVACVRPVSLLVVSEGIVVSGPVVDKGVLVDEVDGSA